MTTDQLLIIVGGLFGILSALIGYLGKGMNDNLSKIATSMHRIEKDLGILTNDHYNLKEDVADIKKRVQHLEEA